MKRHLVLGALLFSGLGGIAAAASLTVQIDRIQKSEGSVRIALFQREPNDNAADFPATALKALALPAAAGQVTHTFSGLPAGRYAVAVFQDLDGNEKLTRGAFGVPIEPWGFSNNVRGHMGPPRFEDAAIRLGERDTTLTIHLNQP